MKRLGKEASRQRRKELRDQWNAYDPIGVMGDPDWPRDEYEVYVGPTMRRLEEGATVDDIVRYLEEVSNYIGINFDRPRALEQSAQFIRWYAHRWRDTRV
jgi:hypothetical protein